MATADLTNTPAIDQPARRTRVAQETSVISRVIGALASLKLTVFLFALSIFLVFVGTLAQVDHDVWHVVNHTYFRVWVADVEFRAFGRLFAMFKMIPGETVAGWTGSFPFPGGMLIGSLLGVNLLAAHSIRFKAAAKGKKLSIGLGVIALGTAATIWAIISGMDNAVESQLSPAFCNGLWQSLRASLAGFSLLSAYWLISKWGKIDLVAWGIAAAVVSLLVAVTGWLLLNPDVRIDDAGLRILWQLTKGLGAAALLLAGCWIVFYKRAGIVLLHAGIGLLLASELTTYLTAEEAQMAIAEGETVNHVYDIRTTELAIIERSAEDADRVTVVPQHLVDQAATTGEVISHDELPFDLRVLRFDMNSMLVPTTAPITASVENLATKGAGTEMVAMPVDSVNGIGMGGGVNLPSAYVELIDKASGEPAGVYLASAAVDQKSRSIRNQTAEVNGKEYDVALRFKRIYKPYSVTLKDFRFDKYIGTTTAKNYSSLVQVTDPTRQIDREWKIFMNNPLRYGGDTLYQANFDEKTEQITYLQVVTNQGWMMPYVSCMLVGVGMLAHFGISLMRFVGRRSDTAAREAKARFAANEMVEPSNSLLSPVTWKSSAVWFPTLMAILVGGYLLGKARPAEDGIHDMQISRFAALPLADGGRIKPYDSLARNTLQFLSARQEIKLEDRNLPATEWMLDVITRQPKANDYRIFRIDNLDVLETLGLEVRPGSFRYSYAELTEREEEIAKQFNLIKGIEREQRTLFQNRIDQLSEKLFIYRRMQATFDSPPITGDPSKIRAEIQQSAMRAEELRNAGAPRVVAPVAADGEWQTLFEAELMDLLKTVRGEKRNPAAAALMVTLDAYAKNDKRAFNEGVRNLEETLKSYQYELNDPDNANAITGLAPAERMNLAKVKFETFFSHFSPFYYCAVAYLFAFILAALSWLGWTKPLSRASTAVIVVTLLVHTFAVVGRIYISGRPPVTNLYSSAVFIGWAAVLLGVLIEALYRMGIGNIVASVIGFLTLVVAYQLSLDGDTFTVLQAVLDTQFWLATHVVCITLGYSTTFLAGFLGIMYLLGGHVLGGFDKTQRDAITRMAYGTLCFALFFSFIGTVLGGLWADDSWGRFWGWDPKENGALIIVIWNALILHARWGKMISAKGLAVLAVLGNVVTTWSWFGVNELGVGLHAYGANDSSTGMWLMVFAISQFVIAALGFMPASSDQPNDKALAGTS